MKIVELIRLEESEQGTFGVLRINKQVFCVTLEPHDMENEPFESSIPAQQYICEKAKSVRHGHTFEVMNVPGRTDVLFHPGNRMSNTQGCILLGQYFGKLRNERAIRNSGYTFERFKKLMEDEERFHLTVYEAY